VNASTQKSLLVAAGIGLMIVGALLWKDFTSPPPLDVEPENILPPESHSFLLTAEKFDLLSLNPKRVEADAVSLTNEPFHRHQVLGQSPVTDRKMREELVQSLADGIKHNRRIASKCFNPRHGIRARRGTNTLDLVICFECGTLQWYRDQAKDGAFVNGDPEKIFNAALQQLKLPLAKD
jgi:hypothetical protein